MQSAQARLLLIDDNLADLRVLTEIATRHGWSVSVALSGKDGFNKARLSPFDLILLDVCMPGLDGFGTCRLLKADSKSQHIPVIFLSAVGDQHSRLEGLLLGAVDYIVKEYANEEEIAARIAIHLRKATYGSAPENESKKTASSLPSALLKAAESLLLQRMSCTFSAAELSAMLGTTEKKLNEIFRRAYGVTAFSWLREERYRIARQMLAETDASIKDIGLNLGYSSSQNFATAFRERFHCTPKEFRAELNKQSLMRIDVHSSNH